MATRTSLPIAFAAIACLWGTIGGAMADSDDPAVPRFEDVGATAGIDHVFEGEWEYMVGGGAAVFDCDDDGMPDVFLAGGSAAASFYRNTGERQGSLAFEKAPSGLEIEAVTGAYPLDIDSDGHVDIVLLRVGENMLMRGLGQCRFERANEDWGFDGGDAWSTAFSATFEAGASWPTLAVGNYVDREEEMFPWGSCTDNWLHRPQPSGAGFAAPQALRPSHCALSMLFTDWDRSGTPSLRVSNDREYYRGGQEQLWRIAPDEKPSLYGEDDGWEKLQIWGMGIASYDLDFNGYPDYFLTSMADNKLQTLKAVPENGAPAPTFIDVAYQRGATAHRPYTGDDLKPSTAWHTAFEDVNNDGLADLFIVKGNVWEMPDFALEDPNNLLLQRADGTFLEAGHLAGVASTKTARGGALADFNRDGSIDLLVVNRHAKAELWQNVTPRTNGFIAVSLRQDGANRNGIGAWIEVRRGETVMRREVTVGGGHAGGVAGPLHFGIGTTQTVDIRAIWPDGNVGDWQTAVANATYLYRRGDPLIRR